MHKSLNIHATEDTKTTQQFNLKKTEVDLVASDKIKLTTWYIPVAKPKAVLILVHGFSIIGGRPHMLGHAKYLSEAGYSTLLLNLRSFGNSQGNKITLGVNEWKDLVAAYDYLKSLPENRNLKIGYMGVSMGASTSIITVGHTQKGDFIIASVPYSSFDSLFKIQIKEAGLPIWLFYPFLKLAAFLELGWDYQKYNPVNNISRVNVPQLLFLSSSDENNGNEGIELFQKANPPKELWSYQGGHDIHGENPTEFKNKVLNFLEKHIK